MIPNIIWAKNQPKDYDKYAGNESKILLALERVGEVLVSCIAVILGVGHIGIHLAHAKEIGGEK